jgi:hypothetical protein
VRYTVFDHRDWAYLAFHPEDAPAASSLAKELRARGLPVWWSGGFGRPWVGNSSATIVVWSKRSARDNIIIMKEIEGLKRDIARRVIHVHLPDLKDVAFLHGSGSRAPIPIDRLDQIVRTLRRLGLKWISYETSVNARPSTLWPEFFKTGVIQLNQLKGLIFISHAGADRSIILPTIISKTKLNHDLQIISQQKKRIITLTLNIAFCSPPQTLFLMSTASLPRWSNVEPALSF